MTNLVTLDFGESFASGQPVGPLLADAIGRSAKLAGFALLLTIPTAIAAGLYAARRRDKRSDRVIVLAGVTLSSIPEFVIGTFLVVLVGVQLKWFPVLATPPEGAGTITQARYLFMPALAMAVVYFGYIARMTRAGAIEVLESDYVRTATMKGLKTGQVMRRHVLRNALIPTIAVIGVQVGYLFGGIIGVEKIFNYNGMGQLMLFAAQRKDIPVLQAGAVVIGIVYMVATLIADLVIAWMNPRIRSEMGTDGRDPDHGRHPTGRWCGPVPGGRAQAGPTRDHPAAGPSARVHHRQPGHRLLGVLCHLPDHPVRRLRRLLAGPPAAITRAHLRDGPAWPGRVLAGGRGRPRRLHRGPPVGPPGRRRGHLLGLIMGFYRGRVDDVLSRIVEAFLSLPVILIALLTLVVLGSSTGVVILVVGILFTPIVARTVRSAVLAERQLDYVTAARLRGESGPFIMVREILPNILPPIIVEMTVRFGYAIFTVATLSFLGVGIQPPSPDWGLSVSEEYSNMIAGTWWPTLFPALAIATTVIAINLIADALAAVAAE